MKGRLVAAIQHGTRKRVGAGSSKGEDREPRHHSPAPNVSLEEVVQQLVDDPEWVEFVRAEQRLGARNPW